MEISRPDVTGEWESKLNKIAEGSFDSEVFVEEIKNKAGGIIKELYTVTINVEEDNKTKSLLHEELTCPLCGGKIVEGVKTVRCENYKQDEDNCCKFLIFKSNKFHDFTSEEIKELTTAMETSKVIEIKSKDKTYKVRFKFDKDKNMVDFVYDNSVPGVCPKCGKFPKIDLKSYPYILADYLIILMKIKE